MKLTRYQFNKFGIFGVLAHDDDSLLYQTLEHGYPQSDGTYLPKIPDGIYTCKRGIHRLEGMLRAFETFEIQSVPGHTNLLFHPGNLEKDSSGCVLLGLSKNECEVLHSRDAFRLFMAILTDIDSFILTVTSERQEK